MDLTKELALELFNDKYVDFNEYGHEYFDSFDEDLDGVNGIYVGEKLCMVKVEPFGENIKNFIVYCEHHYTKMGEETIVKVPTFVIGTLIEREDTVKAVKYATRYRYIDGKRYKTELLDDENNKCLELIEFLIKYGDVT